MTLSDRLDEMREALPGCSLVSLGDLQTGLALRCSSTGHYKQDYLDTLLAQAMQCFAACDAVAAPDRPSGDSAIVATPDDVRIYVRSARCRSDVLCFVCADHQGHDTAQLGAEGIFLALSENA